MTTEPRDPNPDSPPVEDDRRSIEQVDEPGDPREADDHATDPSPDALNGAVGGTDGITKNQDDTAQ